MNDNTTNILIVIGICFLVWFGGCRPTAQASTGQPQTVINNQDCYNHANGIVSPAWAGMNRIQRAVLAMEIINTCEGQ